MALKIHKVIKTCWKNIVCSFVEFLLAVLKLCPTESCATFLDHPIYKFLYQHSYKTVSTNSNRAVNLWLNCCHFGIAAAHYTSHYTKGSAVIGSRRESISKPVDRRQKITWTENEELEAKGLRRPSKWTWNM